MIVICGLGLWLVISLLMWPLFALLTWPFSGGSTARGLVVASWMTRVLFLVALMCGILVGMGGLGVDGGAVISTGLVYSLLFLGGSVLNQRSWRKALAREMLQEEPVAGLTRSST